MSNADEMLAPYAIRVADEHWPVLESWGERRLDEVLAFLRDHASRTPTALSRAS